jgi:hypothetical protein
VNVVGIVALCILGVFMFIGALGGWGHLMTDLVEVDVPDDED